MDPDKYNRDEFIQEIGLLRELSDSNPFGDEQGGLSLSQSPPPTSPVTNNYIQVHSNQYARGEQRPVMIVSTSSKYITPYLQGVDSRVRPFEIDLKTNFSCDWPPGCMGEENEQEDIEKLYAALPPLEREFPQVEKAFVIYGERVPKKFREIIDKAPITVIWKSFWCYDDIPSSGWELHCRQSAMRSMIERSLEFSSY